MDIQQNAPLVYVSFSAEISPATTESLINVMSRLANLEVREVYLLLSTPGGSVMNGMNLYNVLEGMPFELSIHNVGNVDSIGNAIFLAGQKRYATPNATFIFHGVGFNSPENQRLEEKYFREKLGGLLSDQKRIGDIITGHTDITKQEIEELFRETQTKDATFALDKGLIHEIRSVEIVPGTPIVPLVFKR
ncbi:MAG: ATP-dependent Clp protease proteolytic subunit [Candidatus Neomarinimicrobiota bacterium]